MHVAQVSHYEKIEFSFGTNTIGFHTWFLHTMDYSDFKLQPALSTSERSSSPHANLQVRILFHF